MYTSMMRRSALSGQYLVGPDVYGARRTQDFINAGLNGETNLDFIAVGDSNNLFTSGSGGYMSAIVRYIRTKASQYSTALYTIKNTQGWAEPNLTNLEGVAENGTLIAALANLQSAGTSGTWKPYGDVVVGRPWYNETGSIRSTFGTDGIMLFDGHPFFTTAFKYRVIRAQFASGGGSYFQGMCDKNNGTIFSPTTVVRPSCAGATNIDVADDLSCIAVPSATFTGSPKRQNANWVGTGIFPNPPFGVANVSNTGKFAGYYHCLYKNIGGCAVNSLFSEGGRSLRYLALGLQTCPSETIQTYLKNIRLRQIAARGAAGKVIVFIQCGMNDRVDTGTSVGTSPTGSNTGAGFVDNCNAVITVVTNAWSALGYPAEDLSFVVMVSHPVVSTASTGDTVMTAMASAVVTAYYQSNVVTVFDVRNSTKGPFLQSSGFYDAGGDSHLTTAGYDYIANELITKIRAA